MTENKKLLAGLGRISYDLGAIIDSPAQAAARRTESALRRPCPKCGAPAGTKCVTTSGATARATHSARFNEN